MAFRPLLAADTSDWRLMVPLFFLLIAFLILLTWGTILEIRYKSPYTLIATSTDQKWRRSVILALLQTGIIPLIGLVGSITYPNQSPAILFWCSGIWITVLLIVMLFKRWDMEQSIKRYYKMDAWVKQGTYKNMLRLPFSRLLMNSEHKRFFEEGFPEKKSE